MKLENKLKITIIVNKVICSRRYRRIVGLWGGGAKDDGLFELQLHLGVIVLRVY